MKNVLSWVAVFLCTLATSPQAQGIDPDASEAAAQAALSVLSIAATPNETLSSLSFARGSGNTRDLQSKQLRGGFRPLDNGLYVEGLIAYQKYNPVVLFPKIAPGSAIDVTWESVALTLGAGWEFPLGNNWKFRPAGHLSLGHVTGNALLTDSPTAAVSRSDDSIDGDLSAFGVGASFSVFREAQLGIWEAEYRFRQSFLKLYPISAPRAGGATALANQTTFLSRFRYPLKSFKIATLPTKFVVDAGAVLYHGDAARVLQTDWAATAGMGLELDIRQTGAPIITAGRIMLSGIVSEDFEGFTLGFGVRF